MTEAKEEPSVPWPPGPVRDSPEKVGGPELGARDSRRWEDEFQEERGHVGPGKATGGGQ